MVLGSFKIYNDGSLNTHPLTYQRNYNDSYRLHNILILRPQHWLFIAASDEKLTKTVLTTDKIHTYIIIWRFIILSGPIDIVMELQDLGVFCLL